MPMALNKRSPTKAPLSAGQLATPPHRHRPLLPAAEGADCSRRSSRTCRRCSAATAPPTPPSASSASDRPPSQTCHRRRRRRRRCPRHWRRRRQPAWSARVRRRMAGAPGTLHRARMVPTPPPTPPPTCKLPTETLSSPAPQCRRRRQLWRALSRARQPGARRRPGRRARCARRGARGPAARIRSTRTGPSGDSDVPCGDSDAPCGDSEWPSESALRRGLVDALLMQSRSWSRRRAAVLDAPLAETVASLPGCRRRVAVCPGPPRLRPGRVCRILRRMNVCWGRACAVAAGGRRPRPGD